MSESPLLSTIDLCKYFPLKQGFFSRQKGAVYSLDKASFQINKGTTLGVVGESGSGKTTLGRTLLKLYAPTSGKIYFQGSDITSISENKMLAFRKNMQMIFQDPLSSFNPRMRIKDILAEPFVIHKVCGKKEFQEKIKLLLEKVKLSANALERFPHEFSGGQKQRIAIARAIALNPSFIVADEPVSALDVSVRSQILNLMMELKRELNLTYLFISHDLSVVQHMSDYVAVMYLGRIVEYATSEELFSNPLHPYTKILMSCIPQPVVPKNKKIRNVIKGEAASPISPPSGCHFHPRCPIATEKCTKISPVLEAKKTTSVSAHDVACHYA